MKASNRYNDVRKAVEKLHSHMTHPLKKQAIGYVLSLFAMQDKEPDALREENVKARNETMRKAWAKREGKSGK